MGFHQQALAFVALAGPAEADHDRGQGAFPMRPTGALCVACREEGQVVELDAAQLRDIAAAAIAALTPSRFTDTQRQSAQRQRGITAIASAQRLQSTTALR